jgi:hypothetical protein
VKRYFGGVKPELLAPLSQVVPLGPVATPLHPCILALAAAGGLGGRHSIRIFVGGRTLSRIRVVGGSRLTVAANASSPSVLDTVSLAYTSGEEYARHHSMKLSFNASNTIVRHWTCLRLAESMYSVCSCSRYPVLQNC